MPRTARQRGREAESRQCRLRKLAVEGAGKRAIGLRPLPVVRNRPDSVEVPHVA